MNQTKTKWLSFLVFFIGTGHFFAQEYTFKDYNWDEKNKTTDIPEKYKNENEVILNRTVKIELVSDKSAPRQYYLLHDKLFVNADDAIERNNKIYIPLGENDNIITTKVRVILKSGKTILMDKKDIKEEVDQEKGMRYHYFAVNGLEKGAIIEKIIIREETPEINGNTCKMQAEYPIAQLDFELIYPHHLVFKTKSLNGVPEPLVVEDTVAGRNTLRILDKDIPALDDDEQYANWNAQVRMFRYKLDENLYSGAKNMFSFKAFATAAFDRFNEELDKKQQKAVADFCSSIPKSSDLQEQIWNIENKIKKTIVYNQYIDSSPGLADVLKTKQANQTDILALYLAVFKQMKIENNIVFTSDRFKVPFQEDFESYENLSEILFYFPSIKKYMTPTEIEYRIPLFPSRLANNRGLFIKSRLFGGVAMGTGEIAYIDIPGVDVTHDTMDITIDFTKDVENPSVTHQITFGGYSAISMQPIKDFVSAEDYKTILKSIAENYTVQKDYKTLKTENDGVDNIGKKPFIFSVGFEGRDLVKKAGTTYLFSVGQTIGRQMELYQENKRVMPVEIDFPHAYTRKIRIILPSGITVKNLDKLAMDYKTTINGNTEAAFNSKYEQKGNEILIENEEYYKKTDYPLEQFEQYRSVINAAADFNKIILVLNKA
ncbi:DUF3857 domain-containing protein [Flavobacterium sp.]|uniref:DUF3857 domain-containing protein n=1 Tax=Flavobacterium sp. TaxID=239 RepID=UPI0039E36327